MKHLRIVFPNLLFAVLLLITACHIQLVPAYDKEIETKIISGAQLNDKLYIDLKGKDQDQRKYAAVVSRYDEIESEINSLQLRIEAQKKNSDFLVIIRNLKTAFQKYRDEHKSKLTLTDAEIELYKSYIKAYWLPLLQAERGLKITP